MTQADSLNDIALDSRASDVAYQAAADWILATFPNGEERHPHYPMIAAALKAYLAAMPRPTPDTSEMIEKLEAEKVNGGFRQRQRMEGEMKMKKLRNAILEEITHLIHIGAIEPIKINAEQITGRIMAHVECASLQEREATQPVGMDYLEIRRRLSELSGVPTMAITTDEHLKRIQSRLERESKRLTADDKNDAVRWLTEAFMKVNPPLQWEHAKMLAVDGLQVMLSRFDIRKRESCPLGEVDTETLVRMATAYEEHRAKYAGGLVKARSNIDACCQGMKNALNELRKVKP